MGKLNVSKEDMLRSKTIKPGWYRANVKRVGEKAAKTDGSTNHVVDITITQDGEYQGVPMQLLFSEKAPGFAVKFMEAMGGKIGADGGTVDFDRAVNKSLDVYVDNDQYEGRLVNRVKDYRPAQQG